MNVNQDHLKGDVYIQGVTLDNVLQKCRICLNSSNLTAISAVTYQHLSCSDILQSTLSLQLNSTDGLPENVCSNCREQIINIHRFKQKIEDTEKYLNNLLTKKLQKECKLEYSGTDEYQHHSYNDHDYFMEYKPTILKPLEEEMQRHADVEDSVAKAISDYLRIDTSFLKQSDEDFTCKKCNTSFASEEELKEHTKEKRHFAPKLYPCTICGKRFSKSKLLVHIRVHTRERPFTCKICDMKFTIKSNLKRHTMIHTGERPHVCEICGKGFIQGLSLVHHRKTHSEGRKRKPKEPETNKPNVPVPTFECELCSRKFKRIIMFQAHVRKHNVTNSAADAVARIQDFVDIPRPFKCPICHQSYTSKQYLKLHQRMHGEKKFLCSVCGKGFHQTGSLQTHFRMHTGEKPHKCQTCDKSFAYISSLETHLLVHTGEKPHVCNVCGKAFKQSPHLRHHMRVHTGEKPFECPYCLKCFALKGNLTVHIRTHTGETPYKCDICRKGFYDSSTMKKHRKGHRNIVEIVENI